MPELSAFSLELTKSLNKEVVSFIQTNEVYLKINKIGVILRTK